MTVDASNYQNCLKKIAKAGGVAAVEAQKLFEKVMAEGDKLKAAGAADPYIAAAKDMADRVKAAAKRDRLDALRNAKIRSDLLGKVDDEGGLANAHQTIRDLLHGSNIGARDSIESQWKGLARGWWAGLSWELKRQGLEGAAKSGEIDLDIAKEMWGINAGETAAATGNSPARKIAIALTTALDHARDRLNAAGARIGDATDYVTRTSHDPAALRAATGSSRSTPDEAFNAWWQKTEPLLAEKTFDDVEPHEGESEAQTRARFGRNVWEALVTGVHKTLGGMTDIAGTGPNFEGTFNIARKVSQNRTLFWKDAESWHNYMQAFGKPNSLTSGALGTLDQSARSIALMEKLGTNPAGNLNMVIRKVQERYRSDVDGIAKFQGRLAGIDNVMAHLDGRANIPANEMWARLASSLRTWESMSALGSVGITHFASIWPTVTSELAQHGIGSWHRWDSLHALGKAMLRGRGTQERQAMLADLGAYGDGMVRDMVGRWQADDPIPGKISSLANTFMKYTGIHYVFENTQAAIREMLAQNLARQQHLEYGALEPHVRQMIGKYGIHEGEWGLLRNVGELQRVGDHAYLTPRDAFRMDDAAVEQHLRDIGQIAEDDPGAPPRTPEQEEAQQAAIARQVLAFKHSVSDKMLGYYNDAASHGVVSPGVRERAMVLGQERPGSFGGEMRRFMLQFKMWPLAAMHQIIGRDIHLSLNKGELAWNLGIMAALSTAGGLLRMEVSDIASGKPPRDVRDPKTLIAALAQGGGVGIIGDFLFGEVNRMGGGLLSTIGGPVVGDADALIKIFQRFKNDVYGGPGQPHHKAGRFGDLWPDLATFAQRHVPFANLAYVKGTLDYMLWYHLMDTASPGWWDRTNRRLQKEQGRTMQGYAPGAPIPFGVPGLYLGRPGSPTSGLLSGGQQ